MYGDAQLRKFYGEVWDGESFEISISKLEEYYGFAVNYQFLNAEVNKLNLDGTYFCNGLEVLVYLSPRTTWIQTYFGLGAGLHYNSINVTGDKNLDEEGFGGRLIGKAGLKFFLFNWEQGDNNANLTLGGYTKYYLTKDYFQSSEDDEFEAHLYGIELGMRFTF